MIPILMGFVQAPSNARGRPVFEVASIKPNASGGMQSRTGIRPGGRLIAENVSLRSLVMTAYGLQGFQLSGGPGWVDSDRFDVNAVAGSNVTQAEVLLMLQSLLEERFRLVLRRDLKEAEVYVLLPDKNGTKLKPVADDGSEHGIRMGVRQISSDPITTIAALVEILKVELGKSVLDQTGLQGVFNIQLHWGKSAAADIDGPSFFTALQEQLSLRLEQRKAPVETAIIERAEKLVN